MPNWQGLFRSALFLRGFFGNVFHRVFFSALFCWGFARSFFRRCFFYVLFLFYKGLFPCSLLQWFTSVRCLAEAILLRLIAGVFSVLLFYLLQGNFSWSFLRWAFSLPFFLELSSVTYFLGDSSLQILYWAFNVLLFRESLFFALLRVGLL